MSDSAPPEMASSGGSIGLAGLRCRRCGVACATIVGFGAAEHAWCGPAHARLDGWPFLRSERSPFQERLEKAFAR